MRISDIQLFTNADGAVVAQVTVKAADKQSAYAAADKALQAIRAGKEMEMSISPVRRARSTDANALMWACITDISQALGIDKWECYLMMLRRYAKPVYIVCRRNAAEAFMTMWRSAEIIGEVEVNGKPAVQLLCYKGSSDFSVEEMSALLDGIISEMHSMGLETPTPTKLREAVKAYER